MIETWKEVDGWPGYEVSNFGQVRSFWGAGGESQGRRGLVPYPKPIGGHVGARGYLIVQLSRDSSRERKHFRIHRLVLEAFVGPCPPGMECCHRDDDPTNNHLSNLRWDTAAENQRDRIRRGDLKAAKLSETDIPVVWSRLLAGESSASIGRDYGLSGMSIGKIRCGLRWSHITRHLPGWPLVPVDADKRSAIYPPDHVINSVTELWGEFPRGTGYRVSTFGRVQSSWRRIAGKPRGRWAPTEDWHDLNLCPDKDGYPTFVVGKMSGFGHRQTLAVHWAVLTAFACPRPDGMVACHTDDDPANNRADNLRWDTLSGNSRDRWSKSIR